MCYRSIACIILIILLLSAGCASTVEKDSTAEKTDGKDIAPNFSISDAEYILTYGKWDDGVTIDVNFKTADHKEIPIESTDFPWAVKIYRVEKRGEVFAKYKGLNIGEFKGESMASCEGKLCIRIAKNIIDVDKIKSESGNPYEQLVPLGYDLEVFLPDGRTMIDEGLFAFWLSEK